MPLPKKCHLAMQATLCIACHQSGGRVRSADIVKHYKLNDRALEPVLQTLSRAGIIEGTLGAQGGYTVPHPESVTLADLVRLFTDERDPSATLPDMGKTLSPSLERAYKTYLTSLSQYTLAGLRDTLLQRGLDPLNDTPLDFMI